MANNPKERNPFLTASLSKLVVVALPEKDSGKYIDKLSSIVRRALGDHYSGYYQIANIKNVFEYGSEKFIPCGYIIYESAMLKRLALALSTALTNVTIKGVKASITVSPCFISVTHLDDATIDKLQVRVYDQPSEVELNELELAGKSVPPIKDTSLYLVVSDSKSSSAPSAGTDLSYKSILATGNTIAESFSNNVEAAAKMQFNFYKLKFQTIASKNGEIDII
jgi:hypothetical protein